MNKFLCAIVLAAVLLQTTESARGGDGRRGNGERKSFSFKSGRNEFRGNSLPERLTYELDIEGFGPTELDLELNHRMQLPQGMTGNRQGQFTNSNRRPKNPVGIYTDLNGHGSFACEITEKNRGKVECQLSGLAVFGGESCYIGGADSAAYCSTISNGTLEYFYPPDVSRAKRSVDSSLTEALIRHRRSILPSPGFKVVEIAFALDAAFMQQFYDRNPGNTANAQTEAELYVALLANEMNVFYASVKEASSNALDLYVYPARVVYPTYGSDFVWSSAPYKVGGTKLQSGTAFDSALRTFLKIAFPGVQHEHAMALTGLDLLDESGGSGLLGYAYVGTVCVVTDYKYSINEFMAFNIAWVASHELGHALGSDHDQTSACPAGKNVMSAYLFTPTSSTADTYSKFSTCSATQFIAHLNRQTDCTASNGFTDEQFKTFFCRGLLGQRDNSLNLQCQKVTGYAASTACGAVSGDVGCYSSDQVSCRTSGGTCSVFLRFVWNGTPCGSGRMCFKGRCVSEFAICDASTAAPTTVAPTTVTPTTASTAAPTTVAPTTVTPTTASTTVTPTTASTTVTPTTATTTTVRPRPPCDCCSQRGSQRNRCCRLGLLLYGAPCRCCPNSLGLEDGGSSSADSPQASSSRGARGSGK